MAQNEVLGDVATTFASIAGVDAAQVTPDKSPADLDVDSMTMLEVIVALEDRFGLLIPDDEWARFSTIGDLVAHLEHAGVGTFS
jgi:acyl carrier protein